MLDVEADDSQRSKDHRERSFLLVTWFHSYFGKLTFKVLVRTRTPDREPERFREVPVSDAEAPARTYQT